MDRSSAGALVNLGAERDGVSTSPPGRVWRGVDPQKFFLLFDLKMQHFGAVFLSWI